MFSMVLWKKGKEPGMGAHSGSAKTCVCVGGGVLRQKDHKLKVSLGYTARPSEKEQKN